MQVAILDNDLIITFDVSKIIEVSPYLKTLFQTSVPVDKILVKNRLVPSITIELETFRVYYDYLLKGEIADSSDITILNQALAFFGHDETELIIDHGYFESYIPTLVYSKWFRQYFHVLRLYEKPLEGLELVKSYIPDFTTYLDGILGTGSYVIAGGYALAVLLGCDKPAFHRNTYSDVDIFVLESDADPVIQKLKGSGLTLSVSDNCINFYNGDPHNRSTQSFQIVLRKYKSLGQIVYGFDVDCCTVLWYKNNLYTSKRAQYAIDHEINWINPELFSPSFYARITKYRYRNYNDVIFRIGLPGISADMIDTTNFKRKLLETLNLDKQKYDRLLPDSMCCNLPHRNIDQHKELVIEHCTIKDVFDSMTWNGPFFDREVVDKLNQVDRLLLGYKHNRYFASITDLTIDYEKEYMKVSASELSDIKWFENDPSTQITGSFHPEPITDIQTWYCKSQFYRR